MENNPFPIPDQKNYEYALNQAYQIAREKLAGIGDIEEQCRKSGTDYREYESGRAIIVRYLNRPFLITLPGGDVLAEGSDEELPLREKVLVMHYFLSATGAPFSNNQITFRELPEGKVYLRTFAKRTTSPLAKFFSHEPPLILKIGEQFGGKPAEFGDSSVTINAFPKVPLTFVIWSGDEEFSPEANILFDATITDYLSTEDLIVLCELVTWKLVKLIGEV
ncbi:DUF3786 domain-containing protein [Chloroflexota bacterium]